MLSAYFQLRDRTDRFFESVASRYRDQIKCSPGCSKCCESGLTLVIVEAVVLGSEFNISPERIHLQAGQPGILKEGKSCPLLDEKGYCTGYASRPFVCRTHGMPVFNPEDNTVSICEFNFTEIDPHRSTILNTENLNAALFAANLDYCTKNSLNPRARISIDRIAQLAGIELKITD